MQEVVAYKSALAIHMRELREGGVAERGPARLPQPGDGDERYALHDRVGDLGEALQMRDVPPAPGTDAPRSALRTCGRPSRRTSRLSQRTPVYLI